MASTTSKGNYYKRKSKEYYEKLGYTVQLTEFMCAMVVKGKCFYRKIDIFGSDGIAMNGKEIIFWNSKHTVQGDIRFEKHGAKKEFEKYPFPPSVKKQAIIWQPRQKPVIINY
jgi:hypothetical protein